MPNEFHTTTGTDASRKVVLIFFIPGNPGLVSYYEDFLFRLKGNLSSRVAHDGKPDQDPRYAIFGSSLAGFDIDSSSRSIPTTKRELPLSLDSQVDDVYARLEHVANEIRFQHGVKGDLPVVLIGHSIGAYMVLQATARWRKLAQQGYSSNMRLSAGICLFPTIYELALSPTGRQAGPLTRIPAFASIVHIVAKLLFYLMPLAAVTWLVQLITRMPANGANVTAQFLKSPHGVRQALHMAKDELAQLTHDQWSDDFWGTQSTSSGDASSSKTLANGASSATGPAVADRSHAQLHFYWGSEDHWIARETRDTIIATRARVEGKTGDERKAVMEIDGNGIGHAFCLSETGNRVVAAKCADWIAGLSFA